MHTSRKTAHNLAQHVTPGQYCLKSNPSVGRYVYIALEHTPVTKKKKSSHDPESQVGLLSVVM